VYGWNRSSQKVRTGMACDGSACESWNGSIVKR